MHACLPNCIASLATLVFQSWVPARMSLSLFCVCVCVCVCVCSGRVCVVAVRTCFTHPSQDSWDLTSPCRPRTRIPFALSAAQASSSTD